MRKNNIRWVISLLVILVLSVAVIQYGYPELKKWRLLNVARLEREQGNLYNAFIILYGLNQQNPKSVAVVSELAQLSIQTKHPMALHWLGTWAELDQSDPYPLLQFGKLLIIKGNQEAAKGCLAALKSMEDVDEIGLLELKAAILVHQNQFREAAALFEAYMNRHPEQDHTALWVKRAAIELKSSSSLVRAAAVERLKTLLDHVGTGQQASSTLIAHYHAQGNMEEAIRLCQRHVERYADAYNHTRLLMHLSVKAGHTLGSNMNALFLEQVETRPGRLPELIQFIMKTGELSLAEKLFEQMPEELVVSPVGFYAHALLLEHQERWEELNSNLPEQDWERFTFLRNAYLLRSREKLGITHSNRAILNVLVHDLSRSPAKAFKVDEIARDWGWVENRIEIWKGLSPTVFLPERFLREKVIEADQMRDTVGLYGYTLLLIRVHPEHPEILNNHISYALLLNQNVALQLERAEKNINRLGDRAVALTTHALALLKNNKPAAALEVAEGMLPGDRNRPGIVFYQELIRRANGKPQIDQTDFINDLSLELLPEEVALWQQYDKILTEQSKPVLGG